MASLQRSVYVTGLPMDMTETILRQAVQDIGGIEQCLLVNTIVGTFTGNAYIVFEEDSKASDAVKKIKTDIVDAHIVDKEREPELKLLMDLSHSKTLTEVTTQQHHSSTTSTPQLLLQETPKVTVFSGAPGKDCSFGRWKYEVECLQKCATYGAHTILHAVRKSLRSPAAELITHLDKDATLDELLSKLESIYGTVLSGQALLQRFYSEVQKDTETCAEWACRLEDIGYQAQEKNMTTPSLLKSLLVTQFWTGLRDQRIKEALRHQRTLNFQKFMIQARELEEEFNDTPVKGKTKPQQSKPSEMEQLTNLMQKMEKRMSDMEAQMKKSAHQQFHKPTHNQQKCDIPASQHTPPQQSDTWQSSTRCQYCGQDNHVAFGCRKGTSMMCYKCGQIGHIARSCRGQMNSLNGPGPR